MISNPKFKRLLEPGYIGPVKIRNRMIKTAAETLLSSENDGYVTEALKAFYGKIAKGGVGAVYVEGPVIAGNRSRNFYIQVPGTGHGFPVFSQSPLHPPKRACIPDSNLQKKQQLLRLKIL